jgi:eukaryotic-like serine/threonine-protein kinase
VTAGPWRWLRRAARVAVGLTAFGAAACGEGLPDGMVRIPAGPFRMGENHERHGVYLRAFHIDRYEVTNARYRAFLTDARYPHAPDHWMDGTHPFGQADHPVTHVDWHDAAAYCDWAGKRLPTEAEWEKAARGTDGRKYPWGNRFEHGRANVKRRRLLPVGTFDGGASPYGVHDMSGNVWEWTSTLLKPYPYRADDGREAVRAAGYRVLRGGAFPLSSHLARAARRGDGLPGEKDDRIGFRCARSATSTFRPPARAPRR